MHKSSEYTDLEPGLFWPGYIDRIGDFQPCPIGGGGPAAFHRASPASRQRRYLKQVRNRDVYSAKRTPAAGF